MRKMRVRTIASSLRHAPRRGLRVAALTIHTVCLLAGACAADAPLVGTSGHVVGADPSPDMFALARQRMGVRGLPNVALCEGRGEHLPAEDHACDVVLSSLVLMYVLDRAAAAREIARVLRPGGRLIASVWAGPNACDMNVADFGSTFEALMPLIVGR